MKRYCLALDLIDSPELIAEYGYWHKAEIGWPEILKSILSVGIHLMEIYRTGNRLFMIMETGDQFDFDKQSPDGQKQSNSSDLGRTDVEISASFGMGKRRRKMGVNGKYFCIKR